MGQVVLLRTARKKYNIFVSYKEDKTLNKTEIRQIMEEYEEKKIRIKLNRNDFQQQRAMICFSNEKEAELQ